MGSSIQTTIREARAILGDAREIVELLEKKVQRLELMAQAVRDAAPKQWIPIANQVAKTFRMTREELLTSVGPTAAKARQVLYVAMSDEGMSYEVIGKHLGRSQGLVAKKVKAYRREHG